MAKLALDIVIVRLLGSQSEESWVQLTVGLKTATSHGFSINLFNVLSHPVDSTFASDCHYS